MLRKPSDGVAWDWRLTSWKPVKIGMIGTMLFAGLPGNPNAALVTFRQITLPAIRAIAGLGNVDRNGRRRSQDSCMKSGLDGPNLFRRR